MQARSRAKSNRGSRLTEDQQQLTASALRLLASIPDLCSPAGELGGGSERLIGVNNSSGVLRAVLKGIIFLSMFFLSRGGNGGPNAALPGYGGAAGGRHQGS